MVFNVYKWVIKQTYVYVYTYIRTYIYIPSLALSIKSGSSLTLNFMEIVLIRDLRRHMSIEEKPHIQL